MDELKLRVYMGGLVMKKFALFCFSIACMLIMSVDALAQGYECEVIVTVGETTIEAISWEDVPEGIEPIEFANIYERDAFLKKFSSELENMEFYTVILPSISRTNYTTVRFDSRNHGFGGTISLYGHMRNPSRQAGGAITSAHASTSLSGFTLSIGWEERGAHATISGTNRTVVTAQGSGDAIVYLLVNGMIETSRTTVHMSRTIETATSLIRWQ